MAKQLLKNNLSLDWCNLYKAREFRYKICGSSHLENTMKEESRYVKDNGKCYCLFDINCYYQ